MVRPANGSRSERVRRDWRPSRRISVGVLGAMESSLERVDETDLEGSRFINLVGGSGVSTVREGERAGGPCK